MIRQSRVAPFDLKHRLATGERLVGSFAFLPSPDLVEIMALAGFDYVIIDFEHSPKSWETATSMIRAAELRGMAPLVRVHENSEKAILAALECGAAGIVVPFVNGAEDVNRSLQAMRYAPQGRRGSCSVTRAAEYGRLRPTFLDHCQDANRRIPLMALIEDASAVENIDSIVTCNPGPDALMIGRSDLAASLGMPGQVDDPAVLRATQRVIQAARSAPAPVAVCVVVYGPDEARRWLEAGCRLFCYPSEAALFLDAATRVASALKAEQSPSAR